jgi:hypothetical protein
MPLLEALQYYVVFNPMHGGVRPGYRGPESEIRASYRTLVDAIANRDARPPRDGYIAVKVIDDTGRIYRERTAGLHLAVSGSTW